MGLITDSALVLQVYSYSETSKILRLLTRRHGLVSVMARGALRPRSRYGGVLEPFTQGSATFHWKENRELQTLSGFDLERSRQRLGDDLARFATASMLAELVLHTRVEAADPELFERLAAWLNDLETGPAAEVEAVGLTAGWALITHLGFGPELEHCWRCGGDLPVGEDLFFDYAAGTSCRSCASGTGRWIPADALPALLDMRGGSVPRLRRTEGHWGLLERFLAFHITDGRPLRSLTFLAETLQPAPTGQA